LFDKKSRYSKTPEHTFEDVSGRTVRYKGLRFIPVLRPIGLHEVQEGDRLDRIAHLRIGDAEDFWLICDANDAMWPDDLLEERGRRLKIPQREE